MLIIRNATPADAQALLDIYSYYVINTAISLEITPPDVEEFRNRIENTLIKYPFIVLEESNKIVGYAYANVFRYREGYKYSVETSVYVDNERKKMGYGRTLISELEKRLNAIGITNVYACIVHSDTDDPMLNNDSYCFHEKIGYRVVGKFNKCAYKFDRWYNVIFMEKHISKHF